MARRWGGGDVASADGLRFVVPVRTIHTGPNPKCFGPERGVTYYIHEHINMLGRYAFTVPEPVARGEQRPLRSPPALSDDEG